MKKSILLATTAIIAAGAVAVDAQAVDVELYGQVNKGVMGYNVDGDSEIGIVDNDVSSTRFGLRGEQQLDHGLTASMLIEAELQGNASNTLTQGAGNGAPASANATNFLERHTRVGLAGNWGALFLGHTSSATDGITEIDLGPVADILNSATDRMGGALVVDGTIAGKTLSALTDNIDGVGFSNGGTVDANVTDRVDAVRFDTAIYNGVQGRVAYAQGGHTDFSLLYNKKYAEFEVAAGLGYVNYANNTLPAGTIRADEAFSGSVSVKHDSGVSVTGAYGERNFENKALGQEDPSFYYVKAGYQWNDTGFAVDYANHEDSDVTTTTTEEVKAFGLGVQQDLGHGVSVAGYYRNINVSDRALITEDDVDLYGVNLRVKF